jgi:hypothetical protein
MEARGARRQRRAPRTWDRPHVGGTTSLLPYSLNVRELGERAAIEAKAARIADLLLDGLRRRDPM